MTTMEMERPTLTGPRGDAECQARAGEFLRRLLGAAPDDLLWDDVHHLQGHAHCCGHEIVVIAPRDTLRNVLVLSPEDWDAIQRSASADRREMLRSCAIESHIRLLEFLATD